MHTQQCETNVYIYNLNYPSRILHIPCLNIQSFPAKFNGARIFFADARDTPAHISMKKIADASNSPRAVLGYYLLQSPILKLIFCCGAREEGGHQATRVLCRGARKS